MPMNSIFPWQQSLWSRMQQANSQARLPHACLLAGNIGMGKQAFAEYMAQSLLCEQTDVQGNPCNQCKYCNLFAAKTHPDYYRVTPESTGKAIKIDQIRDLQKFAVLTSKYGKARVILVSPAEAMNNYAANSLLKLLEEPPPRTYIFLISHNPAILLATIRSRCQYFDFQNIDKIKAYEWLQQQLNADANIELLMKLSHKAPLTALAMAENLDERQQIFKSWQSLLQQQQSPVKTAEQWAAKEPLLVVECLLSWCQDLLRYLIAGTDSLQNTDYQETLKKLANNFSSRLDSNSLFGILDAHLDSLRLIRKGSSVKPQSLLENLAINWLQLVEAKGN